MPSPLDTRLDDLLRPRGETGRVLVTGWFSFLDGEVTAGDALAQRAVSASLDRLGIVHDTAWSPAFVPGGLSLDEALPSRYEQLLFVCGPLHDVFTHHCRKGVAAMAASLERLDALVFTGEIGEDQPEVREEVGARLPALGLAGGLRGIVAERPEVISGPGARIPVIVVPTGEAQQVDRETRALLGRRHGGPRSG